MSDPDCCPRCGTFWSYHDEQACADEVFRENERLRDEINQLKAKIESFSPSAAPKEPT